MVNWLSAFGSGQGNSGGGMTGPPQAGIGTQNQGWASALSEGAMNLLQDPNFQMLVTQMASQIDPEGVGRIMGQPAQKFLQRNAMSEALAGGGGSQTGTPSVEDTSSIGGQDLDGLVDMSLGNLGPDKKQGGNK